MSQEPALYNRFWHYLTVALFVFSGIEWLRQLQGAHATMVQPSFALNAQIAFNQQTMNYIQICQPPQEIHNASSEIWQPQLASEDNQQSYFTLFQEIIAPTNRQMDGLFLDANGAHPGTLLQREKSTPDADPKPRSASLYNGNLAYTFLNADTSSWHEVTMTYLNGHDGSVISTKVVSGVPRANTDDPKPDCRYNQHCAVIYVGSYLAVPAVFISWITNNKQMTTTYSTLVAIQRMKPDIVCEPDVCHLTYETTDGTQQLCATNTFVNGTIDERCLINQRSDAALILGPQQQWITASLNTKNNNVMLDILNANRQTIASVTANQDMTSGINRNNTKLAINSAGIIDIVWDEFYQGQWRNRHRYFNLDGTAADQGQDLPIDSGLTDAPQTQVQAKNPDAFLYLYRSTLSNIVTKICRPTQTGPTAHPTEHPTQPTAAPIQPTATPTQPTAAPTQPTTMPTSPTPNPSQKPSMTSNDSGGSWVGLAMPMACLSLYGCLFLGFVLWRRTHPHTPLRIIVREWGARFLSSDSPPTENSSLLAANRSKSSAEEETVPPSTQHTSTSSQATASRNSSRRSPFDQRDTPLQPVTRHNTTTNNRDQAYPVVYSTFPKQ